MEAEVNDSLWKGQPECPPPWSVLRRRHFWRQLYRLEDALVAGYAETYEFPIWVRARSEGSTYLLRVTSAPNESLLLFASGPDWRSIEIGRVDESVTEPHTFRWVEVKALADHFENSPAQTPEVPSLAILLLAPFIGGTEEDRPDLTRVLGSQLAGLDLLASAEIDEIVRRRFLASFPDSKNYSEIRWVRDSSVGWRVSGTALDSKLEGVPPGYSTRQAGDFPGKPFTAMLRLVGIRDM